MLNRCEILIRQELTLAIKKSCASSFDIVIFSYLNEKCFHTKNEKTVTLSSASF